MNLDKEKLFSLYHKLRTEEHIPLVPFLQMPEMAFVLIPGGTIREKAERFNREYTKWRKASFLPAVIVTTEQYIEWVCKKYDRDSKPLMEYWITNNHKIKAITPLTTAISIFTIFYPDIRRSQLCELTGVNIVNLDNHSKRMGVPSLVGSKAVT